ncbi:MAG: hypothetical protein EOO53_07620 [Gammaproteobacteria bacterium]|nr:MAG: hypothetical protein EOO53_07620 [Gammaproteobacteria bacterium]
MSNSIIAQLVKKDFLMTRNTIFIFCLITLASVAAIYMIFGHVPEVVFLNLGFTLLIAPAITCAIVLLMKTIVMEKQKSTQLFIMSLPLSIREFTTAKLLLNLPVFTIFWLGITAVAFYFSFGLGLFPYGSVPFITMIFLGIFVAYVVILSIAILYQSYGVTVITMLCAELGTPAYLWVIAYSEPINSHVYESHMVWNSPAITIVATQILLIILVPLMAWHIQNKKRDFV